MKAERDQFPRKTSLERGRNQQRLIQSLAKAFEPRRLVRSGTDDRELKPLGHADIAVSHVAHVQRQSKAKRRLAFLRTVSVERPHARLGVFCRGQRRVTGRHSIAALPANTARGCPCWKDRQCGIADVAQHFAAVIEYCPRHAIEKIVQDAEKRGARH